MMKIDARVCALSAVLVFGCWGPAWADTLLVGFEWGQMQPPPRESQPCFQPATNIGNHIWKAFRWHAVASGSISYFSIHIPQPPLYSDDEFIWAIYEDSNGAVGPLKAYGYTPSYDWTLGHHRFPVTDTVTDTNIVYGRDYWLVAYSYYMDSSHASPPLYTERGNYDCAPNIRILALNQFRWETISSPPPPGEFQIALNSYHAWSVWQAGGAYCGDGACNGTETCVTCAADCGPCRDDVPPQPPGGLRAE